MTPRLERTGPAGRMVTRRQMLGGALAGGAGLAISGCNLFGWGGSSLPSGKLPFPSKPAGTDMIPQIEHIVVLMLENHSFDSVLGMLGKGDGFALDSSGYPTFTNPDGKGNLVHSFHSPTPCRTFSEPDQSWNNSHLSYDSGTNQGFVLASGDDAMAYLTSSDLPFTYGIAGTFAIADRYFCSLLSQTFPNRRYLISGTSYGLAEDLPSWTSIPDTLANHPPNGTIFDTLNTAGVSWKNYNYGLSSLMLYPYLLLDSSVTSRMVGINEFFSDAAKGTLPSFSLIDPNMINFVGNSQGEGDDVQLGDHLLGSVVNALMQGPKWSSTLFVWNYDEGGGYYDHVPPPAAVPPDSVAPQLSSGDVPGGFDRYGFRVPAGIVSPYSKPGYVSHEVYDHTSVLKLVETKWNLPPLTARDAAANDMLDLVDLSSKPAFLTPPPLPTAADPATWTVASCELNSSQNPPAGFVTPAA